MLGSPAVSEFHTHFISILKTKTKTQTDKMHGHDIDVLSLTTEMVGIPTHRKGVGRASRVGYGGWCLDDVRPMVIKVTP